MGNQTDNDGRIEFHVNDKKIKMSFNPTVTLFKLDDNVEAKWEEYMFKTAWYPATITADNGDGTYKIKVVDGLLDGEVRTLPAASIRSMEPNTNPKKLKMDVSVPYQLITQATYLNTDKENQVTFNMIGMKCKLKVVRNKTFAGEGSRWFHKKINKEMSHGVPLCDNHKLLTLLTTKWKGFYLVNVDPIHRYFGINQKYLGDKLEQSLEEKSRSD